MNNDVYLLGPGDIINIDVLDLKDETIEHKIQVDGTVYIPFIGRVFLSDLTIDEAMKKISKNGSGLIILIDGGKNKEEEIQDLKKSYKQSIPGGIDVRRIGAGSQILRDLGVHKIALLGSKTRYPSISGFGLEVVKYIEK